MTDTVNLGMPQLSEGQGSKYITHNEALDILDTVVQLSAIDITNTPPGSPSRGDVYILGTSPTGAWSGKAKHIGYYNGTTWLFIEPKEGMQAWVKDEDTFYVYNSTWNAFAVSISFQNIPMVGINTTADATNKLSVNSPAVLFNHNGTSFQLKLNKNAAANTASVLFQTGFSGRAEIGLMGDDDFRFKVSPDGSSFFTGIFIDKDDGGIDALFTSSDVPSAATCDIGAATTQRVRITGTTGPITSFGVVVNKIRFIRFAGIVTLTHNATTLILPSSANIVTAADDTAIAVSDSSGNWRVIFYQRKNGKALIPTTLYASLAVGSRETDRKFFVEGNVALSNVDVANASYASKSFSVAGEELTVSGVYLSPDGTRMYITGSASDNIREYILTTPGDVNTAALNASFSVNAQDGGSNGILFKPDGTKFYMVGTVNDTIYQYSMATPWQISTASYDSVSFSVAGQDTVPADIEFRPDGTKLYMIGSNTDAIYQYTLTTAWDLSTASYDSVSFSVAGQDSLPQDFHITADGCRVFVLGDVGNDVTIYNLTTAWNISTCVYVTEFSVGSQDTTPGGLFLKSDGSVMYVAGQATDTVYQYSLPLTIYDIVGKANIYGDCDIRNNLKVNGKTSLGQEITANKRVITAGTTGAATIHAPIGAVNFAAGAASVVVTNSYCTANSIILATVATNDTTMLSVKAVAGSGSFTLYAGAAPTAETRVNFLIMN